MKQDMPFWKKYSLSIEEAASYFGIGTSKLYNLIRENPDAEFILMIGTHCRIKRLLFEKYLNEATAV